jgi:glyceraldehyde 3-phosphate dehydrogenase
MIKVAVNGFGRIGRRVARLILESDDFELVGINDLSDSATMAHLLKYDSVHGVFSAEVRPGDDCILVKGKEIPFYRLRNPADIPWTNADYVIESTGNFKTSDLASGHLKPGVKAVIISAPPDDGEVKTVVMGINDNQIAKDDRIISNASCTTNSAAPLVKIIDDLCGVQSAYITTVHSYTSDQRLQDAPHRDLRRARAAAHSIVPTTTGAAKAITRIFPQLEGKMGGCGIRVPVPNGSLTDISYVVSRPVPVEEINKAFELAAQGELKNILQYTDDPVVSSDIIGNPHSCVFDSRLTSVIDHMVKVVGWYDNETGYSRRLLDLISHHFSLQNA